MKIFFRIPLIIFSLAAALFSCSNDMSTIKKYIDEEIEPDLLGENIEILYSDSARLLMKMSTPLLKQFSSAKEQRREFPEGIHVWFYEKTGELKAELTANWAKHDSEKDLWEARSNVVIISAKGEKLETEQFFWDPKKGIVYSEKYTKITQENGSVASGKSFSANQDFTDAKFIDGRATIVLKDEDE
jgi:LPS export ABC transporter protein LptC